MRQDEDAEFREGVVVDRPTKAGQGSLVNCGMKKEVKIDKKLEPGLRVTVRLSQQQLPECKTYKGTVVSSQDPRTKAGLYWGYTVRLASCLSKNRRSSPECPSVPLVRPTSQSRAPSLVLGLISGGLVSPTSVHSACSRPSSTCEEQ